MSLPKEMDYSLASLPPSITQASYVSRATNGSSFTSGQQVQFNFIQNAGAYLVPESLYLSFTINITGAVGANTILGIPGASVWSRSDLFGNSASIETINNYGAVVQALLHNKMNVAQKMGLSNAFGTTFTANEANAVDSYDIEAGSGAQTVNCAIPLCNVLSNASKYVPLDIAQFILYLTVEELANFCVLSADGGATTATAFSVSNLELHYKCVSLDGATDAMVKSQVDGAGEINFKSQSYQSTVAQVANLSSGSQAVAFANSLTSIKSLWCLFARSDLYKYNAGYDITQGTGSLNWECAGRNYPQTAINTSRRTNVLEFLEAIHGVNVSPDSNNTCMSVNNYKSSTSGYAAADLKDLPKVYFGVNCERLAGNYMLSGISSQNSNIALRFNIDGGATNVACNILQVFHHDLIMKYNPSTGAFFTLR